MFLCALAYSFSAYPSLFMTKLLAAFHVSAHPYPFCAILFPAIPPHRCSIAAIPSPRRSFLFLAISPRGYALPLRFCELSLHSTASQCYAFPLPCFAFPFLCSSVQIDSAAFLFIAEPSLNDAVLCRPMLFRCLSFHSYAISQHFRSMPSLCMLCYSLSQPDHASLCRFISMPFLAMPFRCDAVHRLLSSTQSNSFSMYCFSISMLITAMPSLI